MKTDILESRKTSLPAIRYCEIASLLILITMTFLPTFSWMWERFNAKGTFYSHGPLIPFLAIFLIWIRRAQLRLIERKPSTAGLPIIIGALAIHLLAVIIEIQFISGLALIMVIVGISAYLLGLNFTMKISPAIVLLLFMVPMPRVSLIDTAFLLQLASAKGTVPVLRAMGIHAVREGVYLNLPNGSVLEVAYACSGLRSLIVFIATAWIIIAMAPRIRVSSALFLLALSIPIALISNIFRLAITAMAAIHIGLSETVHTLSGLVTFVLYIIIMLWISKRILWKEGS